MATTFQPQNNLTIYLFVFSFGLTENYIVMVEQPLSASLLKLATMKIANCSYRDALEFSKDEKAGCLATHLFICIHE